MSSTSAIHDPLEINLSRQTRHLLSIIPSESEYAEAIKNASTTREFLATLSRLLTVPAYTQLIATYYRPILLDLCARWIEVDDSKEEQLVALCLLLEVHEELFPILYEILCTSYKEGPLSFINETPSLLSINVARLHWLLLAYYRILQANRELPQQLSWPLAPLSRIIWMPHLDNAARLLSIRCYALQSGMGEEEREKLEREVLGEPCGVDCLLGYGQNEDGSEKNVDGWIMPVIEVRRIQEERDSIVTKPHDYYTREDGDSAQVIQSSDLSPYIASIYGVLLLRTPRPLQHESSLIPTPTSIQGLQSLALHVSLRIPTLMTSSPSAGKALLLSHLAGLLHSSRNHIITIHLADTSLDPRALLGSYVSSTTRSGTFEWKEGVLVRSMREGKWVVFEDIDRGSSEVLGVIKPLVESLRAGKWIGGCASLNIPSRGRVVAHHDFMIFATRSSLPSQHGIFPKPSFFGAHKFHEIVLQSPTTQELQTIIDSRFPRLAGSAAQAIIRLCDSVQRLGSSASAPEVGLRQVLKFCMRIDRLLPPSHRPMCVVTDETSVPSLSAIFTNPTLREDMYLEARDVFFGAGASTTSARAHIEAVANIIGEHLGLDSDRRQWILFGRTPEFEVEKDINGRTTALCIGRTYLQARQGKSEISPSIPRPFAMHKPAILLLSRIATAVALGEPVLLTGETGTGKTSVITHLATLLHRPLISLNLSHQTESSDLIGGLKPVDARIPGSILQEKFLELFGATFSRRKNEKFEVEVRKAVNEAKWKRAVGLWKESTRLAQERFRSKREQENRVVSREIDLETPRKRRKVEQDMKTSSEEGWIAFLRDVEEFEVQHVHGKGKFAFGFVEGPLVKALRSGEWILLDEINLASPETLECISGLLHGPTASITLSEQGSLEPVPRHPDFRLFACMNPATDVGKKDLPPNIRSRFTEIDVPPPDADKETLLSIITQYIGPNVVGDKGVIMNIAEFYVAVKELSEKRQIADGANHRPHFSMRTLARALTFAAETASSYSLRRSVWEGCLMAFTMVLDSASAELVTSLARKHLLVGVRNPKSMLTKDPNPPSPPDNYVKFGPFYLEKGPLPEDPVDNYIMTPSVHRKLIDLARIILTRRFPILIEGPTSSGKTSSVEYLAKRTGHHFVRINNHDHTDIQEYIGSYVSDPSTGKLVFKDGLLVQALRNGHWIVLDELNLAPTDVLEALNRLLDDNRELVIPETQEVVRPHPHFMIFATQNPPGLYAGRKVLSRAFRNRFLEVHFEDVPQTELETILCQRCQIAPSYGKKIVSVFHELQKRRQAGRVFESKQGFATLRDLFRWAGRDAVGYQELAENGYMLLAERTRRDDDKVVVKEVIESIMGVKIDEAVMYNLQRPDVDMLSYLGCPTPFSSAIVWTKAMQRLFVLTCRALKFNEPVLLVGETGSGKTSVCQVYADITSQHLHGINCHQNTETADLIGGLRPVRNRHAAETKAMEEAVSALQGEGISNIPPTFEAISHALVQALKDSSGLTTQARSHLEGIYQRVSHLQSIFEWQDGPLIHSMRNGDVFLLDEISLADDSVLERLNSVLEPDRTIVLAERGGDNFELPTIQASTDFKLVATMNPGGDYGKKELSPALRNRFTEIWVPRVDDRDDLELIVGSLWQHEHLRKFTASILDFVDWLCMYVNDRSLISLRDILAWVAFTNAAYKSETLASIPPDEIYHHAVHMTYLDGLSSLPQLSGYSAEALIRLKQDAMTKLHELVPLQESLSSTVPIHNQEQFVQFGSFAIKTGSRPRGRQSFNLTAPTSKDNAMRLVRAFQVSKPILLEGSPGVGKTSLVTALADVSGHHLCRINLSDQTDLIDLFGSDLPVEGGSPGEFAWKDAEFLKALQEGHWVLLDEMNLAPQSVLEGLNAVLDHRGTVYIPELGRSFTCHPSFRIFAAQNPLNQGGGRKGLPKSFVNRFTKVYIQELSPDDLFIVCQHLFPDIEEKTLRSMISYNIQLNQQVSVQRTFAREGSPWEFNLRDVIRWGILLGAPHPRKPLAYLRSVYLHRFRTIQDRSEAQRIFNAVFSADSCEVEDAPGWTISATHIQIGHAILKRRNMAPHRRPGRVLKSQLSALESLGNCISKSWLAILAGERESGKTDLVRTLADLSGNSLWEISINSATDTMDLLGSFEQLDIRGRMLSIVDEVANAVEHNLRTISGSKLSSSIQKHVLHLQQTRAQTAALDIRDLLQAASLLLSELIKSTSDGGDHYLVLQGKVQELSLASDTACRFEWVDGPLIRAMKEGRWILMDDANLCSPSVLDRLNSLCEPDGCLTLSERGFVSGEVQIIKPHPNFRLFMSVDPHYGELSRAMRNRGMEIALLSRLAADDCVILCDHLRLPLSYATPEKSSSQLVLFDATRRGLLTNTACGLRSIASTGRSLDQHSALSSLVDHAPMLALSALAEPLDSIVFFLCRCLTPNYIVHFNRHLDAFRESNGLAGVLQNLLKSFPSAALSRVLSQFRTTLASQNGVPLDFVLAQPFDFHLNSPIFEDGVNGPPSHDAIVKALDLSALLFLNELDQRSWTIPDILAVNEMGQSALKQIQEILEAIQSVGYKILEDLVVEPASKLVDAKVAIAVLTYGRHLRGAVDAGAFDFSAVHAILGWLKDSLDDHPPSLGPLFIAVQTLNEIVSLSTGFGLIDMWSNFYMRNLPATARAELKKVEEFSCHMEECTRSLALRSEAFKVMALVALTTVQTQDIHVSEIVDLKTILERCLLASHLPQTHLEYHIDPQSLILELGALTECQHDSQLHMLKEVIDLACESMRVPLLRLVPYQHLLWTLETRKENSSLAVQAQISYLEGLWSARPSDCFGALPLLQPTHLHAAISACDLTSVPLIRLDNYEKEVRRQVRIAIFQCESDRSRLGQLQRLFYQSLVTIITCFSSSYSLDVYENIRQRSLVIQLDSIGGLLSLLEQSSNPPLVAAIVKFLRPLLDQWSDRDPISNLGLCWIALSQLLFDLLIPNSPVDPAAIQMCTVDRLRQDEADLLSQIKLHRQLEELTTGNRNNGVLVHLEKCKEDIRAQLNNVPALPPRKSVIRLHQFWSEVSQFRSSVTSTPRVESILELAKNGDSIAAPRERVIQESLASFYQRLDSAYDEFADINILLKLGILQLRLGLHLVVQNSRISQTRKDPTSHLVSSLVAFPSVRSAALILATSTTAGQSRTSAFRHILLGLAAISMEKFIGIEMAQQTQLIESYYEQAFRLWLIDRTKDKEMDEASRSLYRHTTLEHDAVGDAELEEQEFLSLFPAFEDILEQPSLTNTQQKPQQPEFVLDPEMPLLLAIHHDLLKHPQTANGSTSLQHCKFTRIRQSMVDSLVRSHLGGLPESLDIESLHFQLSLLRNQSSDLQRSQIMVDVPYNFYLDPNVQEVRKVASVVGALRGRLQVLSEEWPDQMVLRHLADRCDIVLNFGLHSPVALILSAIEQLLLQTDDWEMYANRQNTIQVHREALIALIVEWRRLELSCWQTLLDSEAKKSTEGVSKWWFQLYDVILRGALSTLDQSTESTAFTQYLHNLLPLLEDFIVKSPLGEFLSRMQLLRSFEHFLAYIGNNKSDPQRSALQRIEHILHSVHQYYSLFSSEILTHLSEKKAALEKEIRDFIKLASWKDVNVQALKQSAQRTHRHLYRIVRKFREVLRQSISNFIQPQLAGIPETIPLHFQPPSSLSFDQTWASSPANNDPDATPNHSHLLNKTYAKYCHLVATKIKPFVQSLSAREVDNFAVEVITTTRKLASLSAPEGLEAEKREKYHKGLLVRKRKAWSDLLKELKKAGLSSNLKPDVLTQNMDPVWIRTQPPLSATDPQTILVENYFDKLSGSLPALRSSISNHHADLTTRELQRGVMFVESGFFMAMDLRSRLANALDIHQRLQRVASRLRILSSSATVVTGSNLGHYLSCVKAFLCRLSSALSDLLRVAVTLNELAPKVTIADVLLEEISLFLRESDSLKAKIMDLPDSVRLTVMPVLLQDELTLVSEAWAHISRTAGLLSKWSKDDPRLNHLIIPITQWLETQDSPAILPPMTGSSSSYDCTEQLINSFLISVQSLLPHCRDVVSEEDEQDEEEQYLLKGYRQIRDFTHLLSIDRVFSALTSVLCLIKTQDDLRLNLPKIVPFLDVYISLVNDQLAAHNHWTKALLKLDFILSSVMHTLSHQGFCKPPDSGDAEANGETSEVAGGVGLGDGAGTENVSKEIEDESQVEGLQGETPESQEPQRKHDEGEAIEMNDDFGGDLEDVLDSGSEDDADPSEGSEGDPDETLGNLDASDPSVLDEKLWGDEKGPDDPKHDEEQADQDHSKQHGGNSEVVAKEGKARKESKEKEGEQETDDTMMEDEPGLEGEDDGANDQNVSGAPMDDYVPEANTLDLPDNMELGEDGVEPGGEDKEEEMGTEDGEDEKMEDGDLRPEVEEATDQNSAPDDSFESPEVQNDSTAGKADENEDDREVEEGQEVVAKPDIFAGEGAAAEQDQSANPDVGESTTTGEMGSSESRTGQSSTAQNETANEEGHSESLKPQIDPHNVEPNAGEGSATFGSKGGQAPSQSEEPQASNPLRDLGDTLKEIRQRFDEILNGDQDQAPRERIDVGDGQSQLEYLRPEDADNDMQALGPAGEEQVAKLDQLNLIDDDMAVDNTTAMDIDTPAAPEQHEQPTQESVFQQDPSSSTRRDDVEGAILQTTNNRFPENSVFPDSSTSRADIEMDDTTDHAVEIELRNWRATDYPDDGAEHIWRLYESLTHDLAYALCEQLRLILEPTLATRLKGDYRTGKRLNMKKIISYIASDYTKDKIWLRRTKPSQREYQVFIALDDSRSMAESHSIHLAYETLALISKALGRLEAGDIAIAKFGETVDILHGFDEGPFTDQAGTKIMSAFRFKQKATDVLSLVDTSLKVLERARERRSMSSSSAADLWQLEIIISDGMCQDHEKLRTVLRRAEEQRVMIVFIILDSLHTTAGDSSTQQHGSSILLMDKPEFKMVDGRMEVQLQKYLDSFPFEYYVVLRNVEALPEVLSGTLKQFFERISEE